MGGWVDGLARRNGKGRGGGAARRDRGAGPGRRGLEPEGSAPWQYWAEGRDQAGVKRRSIRGRGGGGFPRTVDQRPKGTRLHGRYRTRALGCTLGCTHANTQVASSPFATALCAPMSHHAAAAGADAGTVSATAAAAASARAVLSCLPRSSPEQQDLLLRQLLPLLPPTPSPHRAVRRQATCPDLAHLHRRALQAANDASPPAVAAPVPGFGATQTHHLEPGAPNTNDHHQHSFQRHNAVAYRAAPAGGPLLSQKAAIGAVAPHTGGAGLSAVPPTEVQRSMATGEPPALGPLLSLAKPIKRALGLAGLPGVPEGPGDAEAASL